MSVSFWRFWGPLLAYMALIFFVSDLPRPAEVAVMPDYVLHGSAYFVMAVLAVRALARGLSRPATAAQLWGGVAIAIVYGASDEWHQSFVPERMASGSDLAFDAVGAILAAGALTLFWNLWKKKT